MHYSTAHCPTERVRYGGDHVHLSQALDLLTPLVLRLLHVGMPVVLLPVAGTYTSLNA